MTENEAKEKLQAYLECQKKKVAGIYEQCNEKLCDNCELCYAQGNAGEHIASVEAAIQALEEVQQYRALGTPEELRELKDKQVAKKVFLRHVCKLDGFDAGDCPACGEAVSRECDGDDIFCPSCGQRLDWGDRK